jgi:hypothetical protein
LASQQIDPCAIRSGTMKVVFWPEQRGTRGRPAAAWRIPFECVVTLGDDRGKLHEGRIRDVWMVDDSVAPPRWLRSVYWWRSEARRWWFFLTRRLFARPANEPLEPAGKAGGSAADR